MSQRSSRKSFRIAKKILQYLSRNKEKISPLLILTHDYPDPDTLASAHALQHLAQNGFGIESRIVYGGIIGRMENRQMVKILKLPVHKCKPSDFKRFTHVALLDTQPGFQNNSLPEDVYPDIVIDQHPSVKKLKAGLSVVDTECGATSVLLAQALLLKKISIPTSVATALVYGILSDTMNLYRTDRPDVLQTYLDILHFSDLKALARIQNPTRSKKFFLTLVRGIRHAYVLSDMIVTHLGFVENPDLVSQIADFLLNYQGMNWSFCSGRFKGKMHVSLRTTKANIDAGEILRDIFANRGEAGGHDTIAGGSFRVGSQASERKWRRTEKQLTDRLKKRLRIKKSGPFRFPFN